MSKGIARVLGLSPLILGCSVMADTALAADTVRFATFNASLNRDASGQLLSDLGNPLASGVTTTVARRIQQAHNVAEIIQRVNPDILLVNEFDFDQNGVPGSSSIPSALGYSSQAAQLFQDNFLSAAHGNAVRGTTQGVVFPYRYTPVTNTGLASGLDLDNSGGVGGGNDAFGFGNFAGQYGFTVYSRYEIVGVRTFQNFLWKDMPGNLLTNDNTGNKLWAADGSGYYNDAEKNALRLSSKNHVDVTLRINGQDVHFLTAHPTPPTFDGAEDKNGKRNHDEIRFWADYVDGADYIYDDQGAMGGLADGASFVIAGDYNADPFDGDSYANAINQLLNHPRVNAAVTPESAGGTAAATYPSNNGAANQSHDGDPRFDTADFSDSAPGNLRVDYVLPSANLDIQDAGIFWPVDSNTGVANTTGELFDLVGTYNNPGLYAGLPSSDHKAVWVDVQVAAVPEPETYALMLAGLGLVGLVSRRRRIF